VAVKGKRHTTPIRLFIAIVTACAAAAVFGSPAAARVTSVTLIGSSCSLGLTVDGDHVNLGGPILLTGTFGVVALSDIPIDEGMFFSQVFVCHGTTPAGLISRTAHLSTCSPTPSGDLVAHITVTPKVWTFTVTLTGQNTCSVG
jgi:hypothetical protein